MEYPPISDFAPIQLQEGLTRMLLHGILATMAVASVPTKTAPELS